MRKDTEWEALIWETDLRNRYTHALFRNMDNSKVILRQSWGLVNQSRKMMCMHGDWIHKNLHRSPGLHYLVLLLNKHFLSCFSRHTVLLIFLLPCIVDCSVYFLKTDLRFQIWVVNQLASIRSILWREHVILDRSKIRKEPLWMYNCYQTQHSCLQAIDYDY